MHIAIMGSGGIGGYLGARLAECGEDVTFIARGAHLAALRECGLQVRSPFGDVALPKVSATDSPSQAGVADAVVFSVKLYDGEAAAASLAPMVGPHTRIVTLQNGIDSIDTLARFLPRGQIIGGVTYISAYIERPGVIVHRGGVTLTRLGGSHDNTVEALRDALLRSGGVEVDLVDNIEDAIWFKFVTICAFSGGTSLMRSAIGPILEDKQSKLFLEQLRDEGMAVAMAAGHPMPNNYREEVDRIWQKLPPGTRSSMATDLERGKPIELAWLSGRMHELGVELNVATPAHTAVFRALHLHADGGSRHT